MARKSAHDVRAQATSVEGVCAEELIRFERVQRQLAVWRVLYIHSGKVPTNFAAGPWHPDKGHVEHWVQWLRIQGHQAAVQSSTEAAAKMHGSTLG
jgi:hypothetical protein